MLRELSYPPFKVTVIFRCSVIVTHQLLHCEVKVIKMFIVVIFPSYFKCPALRTELFIPSLFSITACELKLLNFKWAVFSRPCPPTKLFQEFYFNNNCAIINVVIVLM